MDITIKIGLWLNALGEYFVHSHGQKKLRKISEIQ